MNCSAAGPADRPGTEVCGTVGCSALLGGRLEQEHQERAPDACQEDEADAKGEKAGTDVIGAQMYERMDAARDAVGRRGGLSAAAAS